MLKLQIYVPRALENIVDVKEIEELLKRVNFSLAVEVKKFVVEENREEDLKSKILWGLSVAKGIRIKQTRKPKSLYLQLIVFGKDKLITFYPQARAGQEITIKEFLKGLLKGEIRCLHESFRLKTS
jgi:predicted XRE-type DNA-binding protein